MYNKYEIYSLAVQPAVILSNDTFKNVNIECSVTYDSISILLLFYAAPKTENMKQSAATTLRSVIITNEEILNDGGEQLFDDCLLRNDRVNYEFINGTNTKIDKLLWDYSRKAILSLDYI